jgi:hypothetical protein
MPLPFGEPLGQSSDGVLSYSNGKALFNSEETHRFDGHFTGLKWQCVEFARRYLIQTRGLTFESVPFAYQIWDQIDHLNSIHNNEKLNLKNFVNGEIPSLSKGDLLIYSQEHLGTGHIALIEEVSKEKKSLRLIEANFLNTSWPGTYAREIDYRPLDGGLWIEDSHLLGLKRPN